MKRGAGRGLGLRHAGRPLLARFLPRLPARFSLEICPEKLHLGYTDRFLNPVVVG